MLALLAVGILIFGLGGQRLKCQARDLCLIVGCVALWMKGMCLLPSILLLIMIYHIYDRSFLREKVEEV